MSVLMLLEWNDTPFEAYERVNEIMGISGDADAPPGLIEHVACVDGSGMVIADVWESEEAQAGLGEFEPRMVPIKRRIRGEAAAG
jgi:hypothetical protein